MSLRPIGEFTSELLLKLGRRAIRHHLGQASHAASNSRAASESFAQAKSIRQQMGLSWPEVFEQEANADRYSGHRGAA